MIHKQWQLLCKAETSLLKCELDVLDPLKRSRGQGKLAMDRLSNDELEVVYNQGMKLREYVAYKDRRSYHRSYHSFD